MWDFKRVVKCVLVCAIIVVCLAFMIYPLIEGVTVPPWLEMISVALWIAFLVLVCMLIWATFYSHTKY